MNATTSPFRGLGIALATPFCNDGSVDYPAIQRLINMQIDNGMDFLVILATTSEAPCLTQEEKESIRRISIETVNGRVPIVMACGGNCTANVVKELTHGNFDGISGILSVAPFYNKPTQEGIYQHFHAIAEASPLPVILYNVPSRTGINISADTTLRLATDCPIITAIKEASGDMEQIKRILSEKPSTFDVLSGDDALTYDMIREGAAGVISVIGNALPRQFKRMLILLHEGNYEAAALINEQLHELYRLLFVDGNPAGIKALLHIMGFIGNNLRLPLVPMRLNMFKKMMIQAKRLTLL